MRDTSLNPSFSVSRLAVHLTLWGACALYLVPLLVMLLTSFKTPDDIRTGNLLSLPDTFTVIGWLKAWDSVGAFFWNSVLITVPGVLISTFIGALNGYVLSMWRFRGSQLFFGALLFGCFLPFQVILLPMSFTLGKLGLANTTSGLVLVHVIYGLAFTTLFFRNYFVAIPDALVKAARLDGAGFFTIFLRIPVRRGVRQRRFATDHRGPEQPGEHHHRGQGIQRRHGRGDDRRAAHAGGLRTGRQVLRARPHRRRRERLRRVADPGDERNMATLELRNLHKSYGSGLADTLRDIRLKIDSGEFLILVGPSGCGKSTLMNCIAGLESITGGAILVDGQDISGMSPKDRDIAMVFQSYALYPTMSVRENIAFGLKIRKMPQAAIDEEVARVARLLQIEHLLERKPSQLSGGQQQRVAMGRALARRPKVYLFDEPLSNLDAKLRVEMRTELKLMHQRLKTTTVYVTHDQIEAMTLGDKVAVMKDGVIQQFGTPQQIYNDPANLFVASFIGSPPMNFIPLRLQRRDGRWTGLLDSGQDRIELPLSLEPGLEEGRELILGVRPEQIALGDGSAAHDLRTEVEVLEPTGPDTLVFVTVNQVKVCCRLAPDVAPAAGSGMSLRFDPARVLLFDAQSGERVAVRTAGVAAEKVTALNGNRQKNS